MRKLKAFNMVEIMIVICLLATTVILCLPVIFNNTKEARIVSNWKKSFAEMKSNFEVFNITDAEVIDGICKSNAADKEIEIFKVISPYLNVDTTKDTHRLKHYHYKFKNGSQIPMQSMVFTKLFAYQENGNVVGFKWIDCECSDTIPCATVLLDLNGTKAPNRIGADIFGLYLYKDKIEAFGSDFNNDELKQECNQNSSGMSCSEYYLRGGKF